MIAIILIISFGAIVIAIIIKSARKEKSPQICTACGFIGKPKKRMQGNGLVELLLWLFFLIPGIIYSAWRGSGHIYSCPKCGNKTMIPTDTPIGQKLMEEVTQQKDDFKSNQEVKDDKNIFKKIVKSISDEFEQ